MNTVEPKTLTKNKAQELESENKSLKQELLQLEKTLDNIKQHNIFSEELSVFLERSREGVSIWTKELDLLYINQANLQIFHISKKTPNLLDKNIIEVFPEIESTPRLKAYKGVIQTRKTATFNYNQFFPSINKNRYFSSEAFMVGKNLVIITRDISQSVVLQEKLNQADKRMLKTQKIAEVGFWSYNCVKHTWFWSEEIFLLLGYSPRNTKPDLERFLDRIDPKERRIIRKQFENRNNRKLRFHDIYKITIKNKTRYLLCRGESQTNSEDKVIRTEGILQDITKRVKSQQNLIQSEKRFRLIADNVSEVFWLRTPTEILYINHAFERIWQIPRREIYNNPKSLFRSVHPKDKKQVEKLVATNNSQTDTTPKGIEFRILLPNGDQKWIWAKTFKVLDKERQTRIIGFATDITTIKKKEAELIKAKQKAEESEHLKSAFLATMSHELRTPLNAIIGFSDLLSTTLLEEEILEYASTINKAGMQLLDIINNIFSVALLESQQINFKNSAFHLSDIIQEIEPILRNNAETSSKTHLDIRFLPDLRHSQPSLYCDPKSLKQIWMILLNNALKFTEKGYICYGYKILDQNRIKFFVKDSGIGIPLSKQKYIFNKFMQLEDTHTRKFGGTGLGLAIVKKIVELMKGELGVNSYPGKGSEFYFILSCLHNSPEPAKSLNFTAKVDWSDKKILIVEDDIKSLQLINSNLSETQIHMIQTSKGEDVELLFEQHPDINIVLMDLNLPQMNGFEATKQLKKYHPTVNVIAQSAYVDPKTIKEIYEAGCNDYLVKPYSRDELLHVLSSYL
ncbi:MAG: response regulator [Marinifilaceae bacterium]